MKHLNKILCMAMLAFAAASFTSCGDDDEPKENTFVFNGKEFKIVNVGIFYDANKKGYNIVLADSKSVNLGEKVPEGQISKFSYVTIDYPESQIGSVITNVENYGDKNYRFYLGVKDKEKEEPYWFSKGLNSISRFVDYSDKVLTVKINVKRYFYDGTPYTLQVNYKGSANKAWEYIL